MNSYLELKTRGLRFGLQWCCGLNEVLSDSHLSEAELKQFSSPKKHTILVRILKLFNKNDVFKQDNLFENNKYDP